MSFSLQVKFNLPPLKTKYFKASDRDETQKKNYKSVQQQQPKKIYWSGLTMKLTKFS